MPWGLRPGGMQTTYDISEGDSTGQTTAQKIASGIETIADVILKKKPQPVMRPAAPSRGFGGMDTSTMLLVGGGLLALFWLSRQRR